MNVTMHDMAEKMSEVTAPSGGNEKKKYYPSQRLSSEQIPEIENYDVGDEIVLHISGKVVSKREEEKNGKIICHYEVETHKAGVAMTGEAKKRGEMGKEQYEKGKKYAAS